MVSSAPNPARVSTVRGLTSSPNSRITLSHHRGPSMGPDLFKFVGVHPLVSHNHMFRSRPNKAKLTGSASREKTQREKPERKVRRPCRIFQQSSSKLLDVQDIQSLNSRRAHDLCVTTEEQRRREEEEEREREKKERQEREENERRQVHVRTYFI